MDAILEAEEKLLQAIRSCDVAALDGLLHNDLLFNLPDGQTATKAFDLETYRSGKMIVESLAAFAREISRIDDSTAVVAVTVGLKAQWHDTPIDGNFRYLRVWKRFDGQWKVIAGSVTPCGQL